MFADLHLHTRFSDGTFTPEELAERGHQLGFSAMALTDHGLGPKVGNGGTRPILAIANGIVIEQWAIEHFNETIRNLAAAVEAFINNETWLLNLSAPLAD